MASALGTLIVFAPQHAMLLELVAVGLWGLWGRSRATHRIEILVPWWSVVAGTLAGVAGGVSATWLRDSLAHPHNPAWTIPVVLVCMTAARLACRGSALAFGRAELRPS